MFSVRGEVGLSPSLFKCVYPMFTITIIAHVAVRLQCIAIAIIYEERGRAREELYWNDI